MEWKEKTTDNNPIQSPIKNQFINKQKMSFNQQRNTPQTGLIRKTISWSFISSLILYIVYSSHFISTSDHQCHNSEVKLEEEQVLEHVQEHPIANLSSSIIPQKHGEEIGGNKEDYDNEIDQQPLMAPPIRSERYDTNLKHIVFGIAANEKNWKRKKEYVKVWFRPKEMRGIVWVDKMVKTREDEGLPEIRVSSDTSKFKYTNSQGQRSALRISRVVSEMLRLGPKDVRWFVMGDDDSVFIVDNVVRILSKYDHRQFYYIGSSSESHLQNIFFSYNMAYGGGGFAISYPLAVELEKMQDGCIQRYQGLYGSDDRIQACMAELGVPLTKETGFHQYDVYGNLLGLLAAHPVTPLASLHHLDVVEPIFPGMTRANSLHHLFKAVELDSASIMQQSICYDNQRSWSISVSWGFVVQITRGHFSPRELEKPARTFLNWYRRADYTAYAFNTRPAIKHPCTKAFLFYMSSIECDRARRETVGVYTLQKTHHPHCRWKTPSPERINTIVVLKKPDYYRWHKSPRRDCCRVLPSSKSATTLQIRVGNCQEGEYSLLQQQQT